ncbi:hypothetical protein QBC34DRAFT_442508 [Podospora aff. communis PSN243]|uniref:Uncharacterized protein n=1 Tax=Podospora aff. communis PSN243 TaxID=3040156 RepID=A0AAV9GAU4_9PEZI|nr:hypothetical protein QBC34DRAFT_442508 [Podospora aff. communis PSN243]
MAVSVVMGFLQTHIFESSPLLGSSNAHVATLSAIADQLGTSAMPKRDTYMVRSWWCEAMVGMMSTRPYRALRDSRIKELTEQILEIFSVFIKTQGERDRLGALCSEGVVKPAVDLHEKMQTSLHHYYVDRTPYLLQRPSGSDELDFEFYEGTFFRNLRENKMKFGDMLQSHKPFNPAKLNPTPTEQELVMNLFYVMTTVPALYMRRIGKGGEMSQPSLVRPECILVMWGSEEKRDDFIKEHKLTQMHRILTEKPNIDPSPSLFSQLKSLLLLDLDN